MMFLQTHQASHLLGQGEVTQEAVSVRGTEWLHPAKHKLVKVIDWVQGDAETSTAW